MEQRSEEWFAARLGKVTASKINDIMSTGRSGEAISRRNYRTQIISERLTGKREEMYVNAAMQHGIDTEDEARDAYIFDYADVEETGLIFTILSRQSKDVCAKSPSG